MCETGKVAIHVYEPAELNFIANVMQRETVPYHAERR